MCKTTQVLSSFDFILSLNFLEISKAKKIHGNENVIVNQFTILLLLLKGLLYLQTKQLCPKKQGILAIEDLGWDSTGTQCLCTDLVKFSRRF